MEFVFEVRVTVERVEGKFAARDEIVEEISQILAESDPSSIDGIGADGASSYEVQDWDVTEQPQPKRRRRA